MAKISPYVFVQELDNNGNPLAGGKIFTYEAGTTTPKETFTDSEEGTANANPVVLDAAGRADVWLGSGSYKFILKDANDVTIKEVDNVTGDASNVFGSSIVSVSTNTAITSSFQNNIVEASGTITLSLFSASLAGEGFLFSVKNTGLGVVTIDPDGSETIDGQASHTIYAGEWAFIVCDGTNWITLPYSFSFSKPTATITASDNILFSDVDDGNNVKKTTVQGVIDLVELPLTTKGDLLTFDTDDARLPVGTDKQVLRADSAETTGLSWAPDYFGGQLLHMQDQKPNNTNGGTNAIGSFVARTLNTVLTNEISGASLSSNQITLPAGTYYIEASMPILGVRGHRGRLQNITDASTEVQGTTGFAGDSVPAVECRSHVFGRFTIAGTKVFEVQQYTNTQKITNGYGGGDFGPDGNAAIYSDAKIWKVG